MICDLTTTTMDWKPKIEFTHALSNLRYLDFKFNEIQKPMALKKNTGKY